MDKALVIGAGAIGRGFLPFCFENYLDLIYYDSNTSLIQDLSSNSGFTTYLSDKSQLRPLYVSADFISPHTVSKLIFSTIKIAFICVGPRNVENLPSFIKNLDCPIFALENDPATVERIKLKYSIQNVFFGVPDVISSCTASPDNLKLDANALHTENGVLYLESNSHYPLPRLNKSIYVDSLELQTQWHSKLYLHNTAHCIAAYLGSQVGCQFLHEAMRVTSIRSTIKELLCSLVTALHRAYLYPIDELSEYADKEIARFSNSNLFDPIDRVARHPLRKLRPKPHGRLIGALELCITHTVDINPILDGITAALTYSNSNDDDFQNLSLLSSYGISSFLWHFLGLPLDGTLNKIISSHYLHSTND